MCLTVRRVASVPWARAMLTAARCGMCPPTAAGVHSVSPNGVILPHLQLAVEFRSRARAIAGTTRPLKRNGRPAVWRVRHVSFTQRRPDVAAADDLAVIGQRIDGVNGKAGAGPNFVENRIASRL